MQKVTPKVQEWTIAEAQKNGWDEARFIEINAFWKTNLRINIQRKEQNIKFCSL